MTPRVHVYDARDHATNPQLAPIFLPPPGRHEPVCLDCRRPLADAEPVEHDRVRCACGLLYSRGLIDHADQTLWEYVSRKRLFIRDGDTLTLTTPPEAIRNRQDWAPPTHPESLRDLSKYAGHGTMRPAAAQL